MNTMTAGLVPVEAQSRPSQATRATVTPAVFRGEVARGFSSGEQAQARSYLQLAQYQQRPGGTNQQVRPIPVPPGQRFGPGYVQPGYVQPGYVQPGYTQPGTGLAASITFGGGGPTTITAGVGNIFGQQYVQQIAPYKMVVTNGQDRYWVRAGEQIPYGWIPVESNFWDHLFTGYVYNR